MDRKWWTLIAVCIGTFMLLLDVTIVNVALPSIQRDLNASFSDLQWVVDAYALTLAALLLTTGSLADLFGRRRMFVIGLVIFSLSSLLSGIAADPLLLNLARGAQGVGGAAMFSTSLALLGSDVPGPRARHRVRGVGGDHRPGRGDRPRRRRRADLRAVVALDLPGQRPDRRRRRGHDRAARWTSPASPGPGAPT